MPEFEGWRPCKDTHAIFMVAATVTFGQPIGDVLWRRVDQTLGADAQRFGLTERQPLALPAPMQAILNPLLAVDQGVSYLKRERPDFYSEQIRVARNALRYESWDYIRWAPFKERAGELMAPVIGHFTTNSTLQAIQVTYVDVFETVGSAEEGTDVGVVIDLGSPAIARRAVHRHRPWHSYCGWFERSDPHTRRLVNLRIDVVERRHDGILGSAVQITTEVTDQFGQDGSEPLPENSVDWNMIEDHAQQIHVRLKALLRSVITTEAASAISLGRTDAE